MLTYRHDQALNCLVLCNDGNPFGMLTHTLGAWVFHSSNHSLARTINKELRPKMSRNCVLSIVKTAFLASLVLSEAPAQSAAPAPTPEAPVEPVQAQEPVPATTVASTVEILPPGSSLPTQQPERPGMLMALNMVNVFVAVLQFLGKKAVSAAKAKATRLSKTNAAKALPKAA